MSSYRNALTHRAMTAALTTRADLGYPLNEPVCVFDIAKGLNLRVQFEQLETPKFEGIYSPSINQITLEPRRPSLRQRFTCAHEIGHHKFRHGQVSNCTSSDGAITHTNTSQEEFLANVFAAFLLMPKAAVLTAFRRLGVALSTAEPVQVYTVACRLGVGFTTLINHCATYLPRHLTRSRADHLLKSKLKSLRAKILGGIIAEDQLSKLVVYSVTEEWTRPVDMVVGDVAARGDHVKFEFDLINPPDALEAVGPRCFRAIKEGTYSLQGNNGWTGTLRCYNPTKGGWWKVRIAGDE